MTPASQTPRSVFVGVTGASGAPYAVALLRALDQLGCSLSVSLSDAGVLVVRHELGLGGRSAGRDAVTAVARIAHIHDVIMALPDGYDTIVAERGQSRHDDRAMPKAEGIDDAARASLQHHQISGVDPLQE